MYVYVAEVEKSSHALFMLIIHFKDSLDETAGASKLRVEKYWKNRFMIMLLALPACREWEETSNYALVGEGKTRVLK